MPGCSRATLSSWADKIASMQPVAHCATPTSYIAAHNITTDNRSTVSDIRTHGSCQSGAFAHGFVNLNLV